jgi:hypothetical protein
MSNGTQTNQPNLFLLSSRNILIRYQTTSLQGSPEFHYEDGRVNIDRRGDEIRTDDTSIGQLVTVVVEQVPDLETVTFSVVLPAVNLQERTPASLSTLGVVTRDMTTIGGPGLIVGQVQTYDAVELKGTAQLVQF